MVDIKSITRKNILVVGDCMLDKYFSGDVRRISPEAPVPVFKKGKERQVLGGAANVAANLIAANQAVSIATIVGKDKAGGDLRTLLNTNGIKMNHLMQADNPTTVKTRFLAGNNQQIFRLDVEDSREITNELADDLIKSIDPELDYYDLVLVSDYLKGLLTEYFLQRLINICNQKNKKVCIDVKDSHISKYKGAFLLKPNKSELSNLTSMPVDTDEEIFLAAENLREKCSCEYVLTTCGARGMLLVGDDVRKSVDSVGKEVFDVTGAGDTVIAYLSACLANGMYIEDAMWVSSAAAGIQVSKVGTSPVYFSEVQDAISQVNGDADRKLIDKSELSVLRTQNRDKKIVFTNGCFDILHAGHVSYLNEARLMGDILVVGLNSDDSIRRIKGDKRPINDEKDRSIVLRGLDCVDYVVVFEDDTPYEIIKELQPDVLVKGADYKHKEIVGRDLVESNGGRVMLIPFIDGKSTSNIVEKIVHLT